MDTPKAKLALGPVDVTTLQERVYQSLRLALLKGQFLPGQQVSLRSLAQALGTSAMPVREAVRRLVAERAFEQASDRLLRVTPYSAADHEDLIRIRIQLERYAAEKAAMSKKPGLIDELHRHNSAILRTLRHDDIESALASNQAFHFEIYRAADSPQLLDFISSLWLRTGPILAASQKEGDLFARLFNTGHRIHEELIQAIARGDRVAARHLITLDIRSAHFSIRHILKAAEQTTLAAG
jgi:DNA-binding GntR family transcriptional regulator